MYEISKEKYVDLYGPTTHDLIRLADTSLFIRIEKDFTTYGDEVLVGMGKNIRDGIMLSNTVKRESAVDAIVTNVVVVDPVLGIIKGNIGIKDGKIVGVGEAGNPDIKKNVELVMDTNTAVICGEGLIATAGGIDSHVHFNHPDMMYIALSTGITTVIGGGGGGMWDIGFNPKYILHKMFEAFEEIPLNVGFLGRGSSNPEAIFHNIEAGVCGLKIHEDIGATEDIIDTTLKSADDYDIQVCLHTDSMNESLSLEDTVNVIDKRTIHAYHVEGTGGGHVPNCIQLVSEPSILCSSTNPTIPYTENCVHEALNMTMLVHKMNPKIQEEKLVAGKRVRPATIAAESILHNRGAISIINSDSQGMGRIGETILRTWQTADYMKKTNAELKTNDDNKMVLRYLSKYTINPAITHGISSMVGTLEPGKLADFVLWRPAFFGVKPEYVFKNGFGCYCAASDSNSTVIGAQPFVYKKSWGSLCKAASQVGITFVSELSKNSKAIRNYSSNRAYVPVKNVRNLSRKDMLHNSDVPKVKVLDNGEAVAINGKQVLIKPAKNVSMNRLYFLA